MTGVQLVLTKNQQTRVYIGDVIEKKSGETGDWAVIPMQIGNQHVHVDFTKYYHISAVTKSSIIGDTQPFDDSYLLQASGY